MEPRGYEIVREYVRACVYKYTCVDAGDRERKSEMCNAFVN